MSELSKVPLTTEEIRRDYPWRIADFDRWLAEHDRAVARRAIFAASDEFLNGHQGDKPHDNFRTGVPTWLNRYAAAHYGEPQPADVLPEEKQA